MLVLQRLKPQEASFRWLPLFCGHKGDVDKLSSHLLTSPPSNVVRFEKILDEDKAVRPQFPSFFSLGRSFLHVHVCVDIQCVHMKCSSFDLTCSLIDIVVAATLGCHYSLVMVAIIAWLWLPL